MRPESVALLWHVRDAASVAVRLTTDHSFDAYLEDEKLRLAVDRAFTIVGEAVLC